jgi:SNF family Na+-dependent transporter
MGVEKGIEKFSKIIMPGLLVLIIGIVVFVITTSHTDANGVTRTGLQGLAMYFIPDFTGLTFSRLFAYTPVFNKSVVASKTLSLSFINGFILYFQLFIYFTIVQFYHINQFVLIF